MLDYNKAREDLDQLTTAIVDDKFDSDSELTDEKEAELLKTGLDLFGGVLIDIAESLNRAAPRAAGRSGRQP